MGAEHHEIMRSCLSVEDKLEALFARKHHWKGKGVAAVECHSCRDGQWYWMCDWIRKEDLEGVDYDLTGRGWGGSYLNIYFYSKSPHEHGLLHPRPCMSRKEVEEAGCECPVIKLHKKKGTYFRPKLEVKNG